MSDDEPFLTRWSRRKREAAVRLPEPQKPAAGEAQAVPPAPEPPVTAELPLPPIESIQAATDLQPFLASTVPAELTRAALRRAWIADPAIRDFVGLSENAWDFTASDGVPGFGALTVDDVRKLVAEMTKPAEAAESERRDTPAATEPVPDTASSADSSPDLPPDSAEPSAPTRPDRAAPETNPAAPARRHGGALPT